ncbi:PEP-CTERM sorting domain-containing protein [Neptunomonas qingdaonensis]|uniref:PEP-CTERM protein-sorting domain-containing protein n=1 Tax=Neptunomonas qingdaonensis TaxID=1045558 RepID=A0A1I2VRY4_9GAMM|nr:PEP-CTERM sorting domain-containing protein [Neptunomonas qingdaonensis]SFG91803.1 PEP-CTERM protein-sorting domain-containing protein [Neptunomonas qingdaonensis]
MQTLFRHLLIFMTSIVLYIPAAHSAVLYDQDFENPTGFNNDGADVNVYNNVNTLYGNQPPGFSFAQTFTVETLLITGTSAFGTGYSDPTGTGGNYAIGMLSNRQDDKLGLSFDVGTNDFLNISVDLSSIDLSAFAGPFVPQGATPTFRFTLYDNPTGVAGVSTPTALSFLEATATASAPSVFDWTNFVLPLDATGNTNGNVILGIDLLSGGYASFDNLLIVASDISGNVGNNVPEPGTIALFSLGLAGLTFARRKKA